MCYHALQLEGLGIYHPLDEPQLRIGLANFVPCLACSAQKSCRMTASFIEFSTEAGILLGGNGVFHAMLVAHTESHSCSLTIRPGATVDQSHSLPLHLYPIRYIR